MGRRPQPDAVKQQKAAVRSQRKDHPGDATVVVETNTASEPPKWLSGEGRKIWERLAPNLRLAKLLAPSDGDTFARYCRNFARWLKLQKVLDSEGETYETETYLAGEAAAAERANKLKRAHPAFLIADRLERQLLAAEDRFGLNPSMRQRIFAARANTGAPSDLFGGGRRDSDPAARPTDAAVPVEDTGTPSSPIGYLVN